MVFLEAEADELKENSFLQVLNEKLINEIPFGVINILFSGGAMFGDSRNWPSGDVTKSHRGAYVCMCIGDLSWQCLPVLKRGCCLSWCN